jgi:hypothetical protein
MCNGGACEDWNNMTVCAPASCTAGATASATSALLCSGSGACTGGGTVTPCFPYTTCNGAVCGTSCSQPSDCATLYNCMTNVCLGATGAVCSTNNECASGVCLGTLLCQ